MFKLDCRKCGRELDRPGGLVFGPPIMDMTTASVAKTHICAYCYKDLIKWMDS